MTSERKPVTRVKLSHLDSAEAYPSVHIDFEPDIDFPEAVLIHVQAVNLEDADAVATMLRAVADTLMAEVLHQELAANGMSPDAGHQPFNPQPRAPGGR